nr:unnamed protein product [Callosobruchus analis]
MQPYADSEIPAKNRTSSSKSKENTHLEDTGSSCLQNEICETEDINAAYPNTAVTKKRKKKRKDIISTPDLSKNTCGVTDSSTEHHQSKGSYINNYQIPETLKNNPAESAELISDNILKEISSMQVNGAQFKWSDLKEMASNRQRKKVNKKKCQKFIDIIDSDCEMDVTLNETNNEGLKITDKDDDADSSENDDSICREFVDIVDSDCTMKTTLINKTKKKKSKNRNGDSKIAERDTLCSEEDRICKEFVDIVDSDCTMETTLINPRKRKRHKKSNSGSKIADRNNDQACCSEENNSTCKEFIDVDDSDCRMKTSLTSIRKKKKHKKGNENLKIPDNEKNESMCNEVEVTVDIDCIMETSLNDSRKKKKHKKSNESLKIADRDNSEAFCGEENDIMCKEVEDTVDSDCTMKASLTDSRKKKKHKKGNKSLKIADRDNSEAFCSEENDIMCKEVEDTVDIDCTMKTSLTDSRKKKKYKIADRDKGEVFCTEENDNICKEFVDIDNNDCRMKKSLTSSREKKKHKKSNESLKLPDRDNGEAFHSEENDRIIKEFVDIVDSSCLMETSLTDSRKKKQHKKGNESFKIADRNSGEAFCSEENDIMCKEVENTVDSDCTMKISLTDSRKKKKHKKGNESLKLPDRDNSEAFHSEENDSICKDFVDIVDSDCTMQTSLTDSRKKKKHKKSNVSFKIADRNSGEAFCSEENDIMCKEVENTVDSDCTMKIGLTDSSKKKKHKKGNESLKLPDRDNSEAFHSEENDSICKDFVDIVDSDCTMQTSLTDSRKTKKHKKSNESLKIADRDNGEAFCNEENDNVCNEFVDIDDNYCGMKKNLTSTREKKKYKKGNENLKNADRDNGKAFCSEENDSMCKEFVDTNVNDSRKKKKPRKSSESLKIADRENEEVLCNEEEDSVCKEFVDTVDSDCIMKTCLANSKKKKKNKTRDEGLKIADGDSDQTSFREQNENICIELSDIDDSNCAMKTALTSTRKRKKNDNSNEDLTIANKDSRIFGNEENDSISKEFLDNDDISCSMRTTLANPSNKPRNNKTNEDLVNSESDRMETTLNTTQKIKRDIKCKMYKRQEDSPIQLSSKTNNVSKDQDEYREISESLNLSNGSIEVGLDDYECSNNVQMVSEECLDSSDDAPKGEDTSEVSLNLSEFQKKLNLGSNSKSHMCMLRERMENDPSCPSSIIKVNFGFKKLLSKRNMERKAQSDIIPETQETQNIDTHSELLESKLCGDENAISGILNSSDSQNLQTEKISRSGEANEHNSKLQEEALELKQVQTDTELQEGQDIELKQENIDFGAKKFFKLNAKNKKQSMPMTGIIHETQETQNIDINTDRTVCDETRKTTKNFNSGVLYSSTPQQLEKNQPCESERASYKNILENTSEQINAIVPSSVSSESDERNKELRLDGEASEKANPLLPSSASSESGGLNKEIKLESSFLQGLDDVEEKSPVRKHVCSNREALIKKIYSWGKKPSNKKSNKKQPNNTDDLDVSEIGDESKSFKFQTSHDDAVNSDASDSFDPKELSLSVPFAVPPLHRVLSDAKQDSEAAKLGITLKKGAFNKEEDKQIMDNWTYFCKVSIFNY